jgi:hypothetical protein
VTDSTAVVRASSAQNNPDPDVAERPRKLTYIPNDVTPEAAEDQEKT